MDTREKVYRNVKALAAINGEPLGDVEKAIGRNPGFLSRKSAVLDVEILVTLAKMFETTVDDLINGNYELELDTQKAVKNFRDATHVLRCYFTPEGIEAILKTTLEEVEEEGNG